MGRGHGACRWQAAGPRAPPAATTSAPAARAVSVDAPEAMTEEPRIVCVEYAEPTPAPEPQPGKVVHKLVAAPGAAEEERMEQQQLLAIQANELSCVSALSVVYHDFTRQAVVDDLKKRSSRACACVFIAGYLFICAPASRDRNLS